MNPGRLHALIDGVFAIAITLLVLDLPKPALSAHLARDLAGEWPAYLAYLVSFTIIGIVWIEHVGMMSAVRAVNRRFLERTLVFLLSMSVIPWPTALAAQYADRGAQAVTAAALYNGSMLFMGLAFAWSWHYLARRPDLVAPAARAAYPAGYRRALLGCVAYVVAVAVAFVSATLSFAIAGIVAVCFAASRSRVPDAVLRAQAAPD